ncbi:MAG: hypothetical protein WKH68_07780, partial [Candidatus Limnocylindria bacterium]
MPRGLPICRALRNATGLPCVRVLDESGHTTPEHSTVCAWDRYIGVARSSATAGVYVLAVQLTMADHTGTWVFWRSL